MHSSVAQWLLVVQAVPVGCGEVHAAAVQSAETQSLSSVHGEPFGKGALHLPPAQMPERHLAADVQAAPFAAPHLPPEHVPAEHSLSRAHGQPFPWTPHDPVASGPASPPPEHESPAASPIGQAIGSHTPEAQSRSISQ